MNDFQLVPFEDIAPLIPAGHDARRWLAVAERFAADPKIKSCTPASLRSVLLQIAATGLAVDGKQTAIIPYGDRATLQIGYPGYLELTRRNGWQLTCGVIREGDVFEEERGTNKIFRHRAKLGNDGDILAAYAFAEGPGGLVDWEVVTYAHCLEVRECSGGYRFAKQKGKNDHPWCDGHLGFPEMMKKTAIILLSKRLPLDPAAREAIQSDTEGDLPPTDEIRIIRPTASPLTPPASVPQIEAPKPGPLDRRIHPSLAKKAGWPADITVNQTLREQGEEGLMMVGLLLKTIEEAPAESRAKVSELENAIRAALPVQEATE